MRPKPFLPEIVETENFVRDKNSGLVWHRCQLRPLYADTDRSQVVYHANYLKFMERARTEGLRSLGLEQGDIAAQDDIIFALSQSDIRYLRPAIYDDLLRVETDLLAVKGARILFKQAIYRDDALLVTADITIATISKIGQAKRIPEYIRTCLRKEIT